MQLIKLICKKLQKNVIETITLAEQAVIVIPSLLHNIDLIGVIFSMSLSVRQIRNGGRKVFTKVKMTFS